MSHPTTLILGCGYLGRRVGRLLSDRGERVFGTTRRLENAGELLNWGIEAVEADVLKPATLDNLPSVARVLYCVGFDRSAGVPIRSVYVDGLRHALGRLIDRTESLVYAGSTGVFGQDDGGWVTEDSPTEPRTESGRACLEAESVIREYERERGLRSTILRYSGLYGPGRIIRRESLLKGEVISGDPSKFLNMIHIDDAAQVAVLALDQARGQTIYLASDDRPTTRLEFYRVAAESLLAPAPRIELPAPESLVSSRDESNKRVSNARIRLELGVNLIYPEIAQGLPAAIAAEANRGST